MAPKDTLHDPAHARPRNALHRGAQFVEGTAFWTAIVLPFSYIPVMYVGVQSVSGLVTFVGLIGLNVVAFVVGSRHRSSQSDGDDHVPNRADEALTSPQPVSIRIER